MIVQAACSRSHFGVWQSYCETEETAIPDEEKGEWQFLDRSGRMRVDGWVFQRTLSSRILMTRFPLRLGVRLVSHYLSTHPLRLMNKS